MIGSVLIKQLQIQQNKAIRLIFRLNSRHSNLLPYIRQINQFTISEMFFIKMALFAYSTINELRDNFLQLVLHRALESHSYQTRFATSESLILRASRTNYGKNFVRHKVIKVWNSIPADVREQACYRAFKNKLQSFVIGNGVPQICV